MPEIDLARLDSARARLKAKSRDDKLRLAVSRRDAAAALGMSLSTFQRHVQPELQCVYIGNLRLYPVSELERWLREHACVGGRAA